MFPYFNIPELRNHSESNIYLLYFQLIYIFSYTEATITVWYCMQRLPIYNLLFSHN